MRVRKLSPTGDYVFGSGKLDYLVDSPETVAQVVQTSLSLWLGEWYLDLTEGIPYPEGIIGKHKKEQADLTLVSKIRTIQGVVNVQDFSSTIDPDTRKYSVIVGTLNTIYGKTSLQLSNEQNF